MLSCHRCLGELLEQSLVADPVLRIVIYADEVNAGDPLAAHSRRKIWMIYWSLLNLGPKHLKRRPRGAIMFKYQPMTSMISASTDADWAGDQSSRKSTSGGLLQFGSHTIKPWSSTQSVIALSSGKNEFYSIVKGCSQAMGLRALLADLGVDASIKIRTDATTGKIISVEKRIGQGPSHCGQRAVAAEPCSRQNNYGCRDQE